MLTEKDRGEIAYQLTKRLVIDMPTARAAVDAALASNPASQTRMDWLTLHGVENLLRGLGYPDSADAVRRAINAIPQASVSTSQEGGQA